MGSIGGDFLTGRDVRACARHPSARSSVSSARVACTAFSRSDSHLRSLPAVSASTSCDASVSAGAPPPPPPRPRPPRNGAASSESRVASISASNASYRRAASADASRASLATNAALSARRAAVFTRAPVRPAETAPRRPAPGHRLLPGGLLGGARPGAVAASSGVEGARFFSFFVCFSSAAAETAASEDGGIERCVSEIASSGASETVSGPSPAAAAAGASRGSGNPGGATSETGPSLRSTERDSSPRRLLESASNHSQGGVSASNTAGAAGAAAFDAADAFRFGP